MTLTNAFSPSKLVTSVPDGDFVFPTKDRYEKVRSGGASDALELPQGQSLENQDAQEQPEPEGSDEPSRERSTLVLDPSSGKLVPVPSGGKYYAGGTLGRRYTGGRGSRKPDDIPSYLWVNMSKKQKDQAVQDAAREEAMEQLQREIDAEAENRVVRWKLK